MNSSDAFVGLRNGTVGRASLDNLNLTVWPNNTASLTFNTSQTDFQIISFTVDALFRPDIFSFSPRCTYAISGQYGFLPRLTYYSLLIFSLILRRHEYLAVAALGASMTYASVACVHAFALMLRYKYLPIDHTDPNFEETPPTDLGDADLVGIYPILVAGCIMLTPILNWSTTVRKNKASAIIVYWGLLMFATLIATLTKLFIGGIEPFSDYKQTATCHIDRAKGCTFDEVMLPNRRFRFTSEGVSNRESYNYWQKCNCNDTCGAVALDVPFRKGTNMQAWLVSDRTTKILKSEWIVWVFVINVLFLFFVIAQGILGLIESKWDQAVVRNWMFRFLSGARERPSQSTFIWKCRYYLSKMIAGSFYVGAIFMGIFCPLVFISSVIINEFIAHGWPVNERNSAVGQWSTLVAAGFVLLAAAVGEYNSAWVRSAKLGYLTTVRLIKWIFGRAELRAEPIHEERSKDNSAVEDFKDFLKQCLRPFRHSWKSTCSAGHRIVLEWRDFRAWHRDPIQSSQQPPTYCSELERPSMVLPKSGMVPQKSSVVEADSVVMTPRTALSSSPELSPIPPRSSTMPAMLSGLLSPKQLERSAYRSSWRPSKRSTYERVSSDPSELQLIDVHTPTAQASTGFTDRPLTPLSQSSHSLEHSPTAPLPSEGPSMRTTFTRANTGHLA